MRRVEFDLEEYRALRAEIIQSMDDGNKIVAFGLTGVGLVLGSAVSFHEPVLELLILGFLLPVLSTLVLSMWFAAQERIARASYYLSGAEYRIKSSFNDGGSVSWEAWLRAAQGTRKSAHFWSTEQAGIALFGTITVCAIVMGWTVDGNAIETKIQATGDFLVGDNLRDRTLRRSPTLRKLEAVAEHVLRPGAIAGGVFVKVALVAEHGRASMLPFSGIPYFMARALGAEVRALHFIESPAFDLELMFSDPRVGRTQLQKIGEFVSNQLRRLDVNCVIAQGSSMLPFLDSSAFVCLWHDSTWQTLLQIPFDEFRYSYPLLYEWDRLAIENASLIAYAADWVREETLRNYDVDPGKLVVVPFGASLFDPAEDCVDRLIATRRRSPCQLTFVGVDWVRKGLPAAHSLMTRLNSNGIPTVLNVLGRTLEPSAGLGESSGERLGPRYPFISADIFGLRVRTDPAVRVWGFLNKDDPRDYRQFCDILRDTHYLVHPAQFECFGVALVEANAFGVPVLAVDAFGPQSIVKPGVNGYVYDAKRFVDDASALIIARLEDDATFRLECESAFREYEDRLNWRTGCRNILARIAEEI